MVWIHLPEHELKLEGPSLLLVPKGGTDSVPPPPLVPFCSSPEQASLALKTPLAWPLSPLPLLFFRPPAKAWLLQWVLCPCGANVLFSLGPVLICSRL